MQLAIFILLWGILILGALPELGQRDLEYRLAWWHPRLMGIISSVVEAICGWHLLRAVLFRSELDVLSPEKAIPLGIIGFYLMVEGLFRLAVTLKLSDYPLPSFPISLLYKAAISFVNREERKTRSTK